MVVLTLDQFHNLKELFRIGLFTIDLDLLRPHYLNRSIEDDHVYSLVKRFKTPSEFTTLGHEGICIALGDFPLEQQGNISKGQFAVISGNHRIAAAKLVNRKTWPMVVYHPGITFIVCVY